MMIAFAWNFKFVDSLFFLLLIYYIYTYTVYKWQHLIKNLVFPTKRGLVNNETGSYVLVDLLSQLTHNFLFHSWLNIHTYIHSYIVGERFNLLFHVGWFEISVEKYADCLLKLVSTAGDWVPFKKSQSTSAEWFRGTLGFIASLKKHLNIEILCVVSSTNCITIR